jgi:NADPH:quinone reductase-like Zn-dependent oxidoreductase
LNKQLDLAAASEPAIVTHPRNGALKICRDQSHAKVVLVTGGSRGIGREVCRLAGKAGYTVIVNYNAQG